MLFGVARTQFQSTRPVRGATPLFQRREDLLIISIHAPRAGRDFDPEAGQFNRVDISIHAPRAGRDKPDEVAVLGLDISIHAPRAGRDRP